MAGFRFRLNRLRRGRTSPRFVGTATQAAPATVTAVYVYNGSTWVERPVYVYDGSAWVRRPVATYTGSTWN